MTIINRTAVIFALSLIGGLGVNVATLAHEETPELLELPLEELLKVKINTVSGFLERADQAAASVTHMDAKQWQQYGALFNSDVFAMTPSLMILPTTGDNVAIRGYANTLSRRGVATLIDGISVNELSFGSSQQSNEHITLGVVDSIDVIRGPASVQYGTDAFHGVLAFKTYYREIAHNRIHALLGAEGERQASWQYSRPYANGHYVNVAFDRIEQRDSEREHWVYGDTGFSGEPREIQREENHEMMSALLKLHNGQHARWQYEFSALHNDTDRSGMPGGAKITGYSIADEVSVNSQNTLLQLQLSSHSSDEWQQGVKIYYQAQDRIIPFEQRNASLAALYGQAHGQVTKNGAQIFNKYEAEDGRRRVSLALEYMHQQIDRASFQLSIVGGELQDPVPAVYEGAERDIGSVVLQGRQALGSWGTSIELGARTDWYSDIVDHTSPRAALIQNFSDRQTLKLIYGESFRAPVSNEISGSSVILTNPDIKPEILKTVELAYSKEFDAIFLQATLFRSELDDGITIVSTSANVRQYQNVSESASRGVELSAMIDMNDWLLSSDVSWIRSEDRYNHVDYSAFPEMIWNLRLNYFLESQSGIFVNQRMLDDMTAGHNTEPNEKLSTYLRYDLGYERKWDARWTLNASLKNIFGRKNWLPNANNGPEGIIDDPRTLLLSVSYQP